MPEKLFWFPFWLWIICSTIHSFFPNEHLKSPSCILHWLLLWQGYKQASSSSVGLGQAPGVSWEDGDPTTQLQLLRPPPPLGQGAAVLGDGFALSLQPLPFSCCAWRVHQLTVPKKHPLLSKCQLPNHLHQLLQSCPQPSFLLTQELYLSSPPFSL